MKKIISALASVVILGLAWNCLSAELPVTGQERAAQNYLVNPGFENGKYGWTASGGATTAVNTTAKGEGNYGYEWDSNSASQTLIANSITIPAGLYGHNGVAWCSFKTPSGTATHTFVVDDGTNNLTSAVTVASSTSFTRTLVNFIFPSSGSVRLKITSVASNEPDIYIDSCFLGEAINISAISQAQFIASGYFAGTASCSWTRTNTALGSFGTTAACPGPTVEFNPGPGTLQTTDADLPKWTINSMAPGYYRVCASMNLSKNNTANYVSIGINDGTTTSGTTLYDVSNALEVPATVCGWFNYTTAANHTFEIYSSSAANGVVLDLASTSGNLYFWVERFPGTTDTAYRADQTPASWAGRMTVASGWTTTSTTYADTTTGTSIVLTEERNRNFGTVSAIAGSLPGITFNPPRAGNYWVCASGALTSTNLQYMSIRMIDSNSVVIHNGLTTYSNVATSTQIFGGLCGIAQPTSTAAYSVKLQTATNTGTMTITNGSGSGASGTPAIEWSIAELDAPTAAPYLINTVVSDSSGVEKVARVKYYTTAAGTVCSADPCGATSSVSGITVNKNATGDYTITFPSGTFSSTPTCTISPSNASNTIVPIFTSASSTTYRFTTNNSSSGAAANTFGDVLCMGPK